VNFNSIAPPSIASIRTSVIVLWKLKWISSCCLTLCVLVCGFVAMVISKESLGNSIC
jgi:hypothetical protein